MGGSWEAKEEGRGGVQWREGRKELELLSAGVGDVCTVPEACPVPRVKGLLAVCSLSTAKVIPLLLGPCLVMAVRRTPGAYLDGDFCHGAVLSPRSLRTPIPGSCDVQPRSKFPFRLFFC